MIELELDKDPEAVEMSQGSSILDFCDSSQGSQDRPTVSRPFMEAVSRSVAAALEPAKVPNKPPRKRHYYMNEDRHMQRWQEEQDEIDEKEYQKQERKRKKEEKKAMKERHDMWAKLKNVKMTPERSAKVPKPKKKTTTTTKKKTTVMDSAEKMTSSTIQPIANSCVV